MKNNSKIWVFYQNYFYIKGECDSIEKFFSLYCYLKRPSEIPINHKLLFFRSQNKPLWELYPTGGTWVISFKRRDDEQLNKRWE